MDDLIDITVALKDGRKDVENNGTRWRRKTLSISMKQMNTRFSLKEFLSLIKQTKPRYPLLAMGMILLAGSSDVQVYVPKLAANLVNHFQEGIDYALLGRVVGMFVFSAVISAIGGTVLGIFGENVIQNMRKRLWNKLTILKVTYFDSVKAGEMSSRVTNDTTQVKQLLAVTFPQTIASIITVIGTVYMMIRMDWHMSLAMVVAVPVVILLMIPVMTFGSKISHIRQDAMSHFNGIATETLSEIRLVKTSNAEQQAQERAANEVDRLFRVGKKEAVFDAAMQPIMMMVFMSMVFGLLALWNASYCDWCDDDRGIDEFSHVSLQSDRRDANDCHVVF